MSQTIVTNIGNQKITDAIASGNKLTMKYFKLSNDTNLTIDPTMTDIPTPILQKDISAWFKASETEFRLYCEVTNTEIAQGTNIAVVGAFDIENDLIFVTKIDPPITVYQDVYIEIRYTLDQYDAAIDFGTIPWDDYEQTMLIQDVLNKYGQHSTDISDIRIALQDLNALVVSLSSGALDIETHNLSLSAHPHIVRAINKFGIFPDPNNFKYIGQSIDPYPQFDSSVQNGMLVYKDVDGIYYPAIADGTIKARVAGYADLNENTVISSGLVDTPWIYDSGTDLYLSMTTPGAFSDKASPVKVGVSMGGGLILLGSYISHPENYDDFVMFDDLAYSLLLVSSPFTDVWYDIFLSDTLTVTSGSATFQYENTKYIINSVGTVLETDDLINSSTTYYRFVIHVDANVTPTIEYSLDSGTTWTTANPDEVILEANGYTKIKLRFTFDSTGEFYSYGILYNYDFSSYTSDSRMLEIWHPDQNYPAGSNILLPNNATYTNDGKSLEIFMDGLRLVPGEDYIEIDHRTVQFQIDITTDDTIVFTEKYGYVDTSIENYSRLNLEHNDIGEHIFTDLTTGLKYRLAVDNATLILIPV